MKRILNWESRKARQEAQRWSSDDLLDFLNNASFGRSIRLPCFASRGFARHSAGAGSLREQDLFLLVGAELHPVAAGIKRSVVFYEPQVGTKNTKFLILLISVLLWVPCGFSSYGNSHW